MTYKPSPILTFTNYQGKTHLQIEQDFAIEQQRRLMEFMISEPIKEIMKKFGEDLMREYYDRCPPNPTSLRQIHHS